MQKIQVQHGGVSAETFGSGKIIVQLPNVGYAQVFNAEDLDAHIKALEMYRDAAAEADLKKRKNGPWEIEFERRSAFDYDLFTVWFSAKGFKLDNVTDGDLKDLRDLLNARFSDE
jgi:hypothetical protein